METTKKAVAIPSWTEEQVKCIALYQEKCGLDRKGAIQRMRRAEQKGLTAVQQLAAGVAPRIESPTQVVDTAELAEQQKALDEGVNTKLTGKPQPAAKELIGNRVTVYEVDRAATRKAHQPAMRHAKAPKAKKPSSIEQHISPQKQVHIDELVRAAIGKGRAVEAVFKSSLSEKYTKYIWYGIDNGTVLSVNPDTMTHRWLDENSRSVKLWQKAQRAALLRMAKAAKKEAK